MASDLETAMNKARHAGEATGPAENLVERLAEKIGGKAGVQAVFGDPIERDGITVIPVARVRWGFGGGGGTGPMATTTGAGTTGSPASDASGMASDASGTSVGTEGQMASGTGAGGGVMADPVGYLEIGPEGVHFRPIVPPMPSPGFLLAAGATTAMVIGSVARLRGSGK